MPNESRTAVGLLDAAIRLMTAAVAELHKAAERERESALFPLGAVFPGLFNRTAADNTAANPSPLAWMDHLFGPPPGPIFKPSEPVENPATEPVVSYEMPGAPPAGRRVTDRGGWTWIKEQSAGWRLLAYDTPHRTDGPEARLSGSDLFLIGDVLSWPGLLETRGILHLVPLTEEEREEERLYGPLGGRWGNPDEPCPFHGYRAEERTGDGFVTLPPIPCVYGRGHIGVHLDEGGAELHAHEPTGPSAVTPQEAAEEPCSCGDPANHQPGCARFARLAGEATHDEH